MPFYMRKQYLSLSSKSSNPQILKYVKIFTYVNNNNTPCVCSPVTRPGELTPMTPGTPIVPTNPTMENQLVVCPVIE